MYGATVNPFSTAFLASSPAPNMTEGLLVLVQLVIAEITTEPVETERWTCQTAPQRVTGRARTPVH